MTTQARPASRTAWARPVSSRSATTAEANDAQKAAAEKFFAYLNQKTVDAKWSLGSGWPPLRTDVGTADVSSNPVVASLTAIASTSRALLPGVVDSSDVLTAVDVATQKAVAGGNAKDLLDQAQSSITTALTK